MEDSLINDWMSSSNTLKGWNELIGTAIDGAKDSDDDDSNPKMTTENFDDKIEKSLRFYNSRLRETRRKPWKQLKWKLEAEKPKIRWKRQVLTIKILYPSILFTRC